MRSMMYIVSLELRSTPQRPDMCFCLFCYTKCKYARIQTPKMGLEIERGLKTGKCLGEERGLGMEGELGRKKN